jgi:catecholate siderophore receptor
VPNTSLLNPDETQPFSGTAKITSNVNTLGVTFAGYVLDDMKLGRRWELTGGFRFDRFGAQYQQIVAPASEFSRVDELPSWRAGLVYKPTDHGSIYVSSGTSFNPSAETLSLSAANANLPPEKNLTYEAGTKWEFLSSKLLLSSAVFRTEKSNAREPDPNNPTLNVLAGNQRVSGVQFQLTGRITDRWQLLTGYAHLDGKVVSSQFYPLAIGAQLANVPANTFTFWNSYKLPWHHIDLGAGGQFVDSRTASSTVPYDPVTGLVKQVPSYWVFNAMARYPISDRLDLQGNIYNIANRYYYDQLHPAHIVPGAGRSALIGINFRF